MESTYYHFLTFDLGGRFEVRSVATQGRTNSREYVTEYIVQYSDDGEGWKSFTDTNGEVEVLLSYTSKSIQIILVLTTALATHYTRVTFHLGQ